MDPLFTMLLAAASVGGVGFVLLGRRSGMDRRIDAIAAKKDARDADKNLRTMLFGKEDGKDARRKQVLESLQQIEARGKKSRRSLQDLFDQAGLSTTVRQVQMVAGIAGLVLAVLVHAVGLPLLVAGAIVPIFILGVPRWFAGFLVKRRQQQFLAGFPDAIDIMVRSIRSGLPVSDAMRMISAECGAPVGPEFLELVEAQRLGVPLEQGLERMYERIELPEINFLAIVMNIQSKSGGNLSEALSNLSRVLRERRKMRGKIRAVSQEAISSAAIIGSLPVIITIALSVMNPAYLDPLWHTPMGNLLVIGCLCWMGLGSFVMHKMIQLDI